MDSIPGPETKFPHTMWCGQKGKQTHNHLTELPHLTLSHFLSLGLSSLARVLIAALKKKKGGGEFPVGPRVRTLEFPLHGFNPCLEN